MEKTLLKLAYCPFLTPKEKCQLFVSEHPDQEIFDWYRPVKVKEKNYERWKTLSSRLVADKLLEELSELGINFLSILNPAYPSQLKHIYTPPLGLFYKGRLDLIRGNLLSVIGSRQMSEYGGQASTYLLPELSKTYTLVSGLAQGIDSLAHRIAMAEARPTIAVIGTGIDISYPVEHKRLQEEIANSHLVLSEYPPQTPPSRENFPERNRIIAGLSPGLLIIEGKKRSGTLITARIAMEEGREVFCVPGPITTQQSAGVHELIKLGAQIVTGPEDIHQAFEFISRV